MSGTLWRTPSDLRLIVIDLETCVAPDKAHRIVALGVVICRAGGIKQRYAWLVNPEVPVDPATSRIHHLTDDDLAEEPTFDEVLPDLERLVAPRAGERVVLAAHFTSFDVPVLRAEIARVGGTALPDLSLLDTAGALVALAGVKVRGRKLEQLLTALGITNAAPHDALGDASATALAACALLERAEAAGHTDLDALLATLNAGVISSVKARFPTRRSASGLPAPSIPPAHVATHGKVPPANPTPQEWADWQTWIAECARLRCAGLADRALTAPRDNFREMLLECLGSTVATGDRAGTATILGALLPMLGDLPGSIAKMRPARGTRGRRGAVAGFHNWLETLLAPIGRCPDNDPCPACREGDPCPTDTWRASLAPAVVGGSDGEIGGFWNTRGPGAKSGGRGYLVMRAAAPALADSAIRLCYDYHRDKGDASTAAQLADQVWRDAECRDPFITEMRAKTIAGGGRAADLIAALRDCRRVLGKRAGNTDPAWDHLAVRASKIEGRLERLRQPTERRHQPTSPARSPRPTRFLRAS